ncbi:MAG: ABC transporter permease [Roseobacter sp.]
MFRFILVRFAVALPTLLGMSFVAFAIVAIAPGDPVMMELRALGIVPKPEDIAAMRAEFGLDQPFFIRYLNWLMRAVQLDFGTSIATGRTVTAQIALRLPATLALAVSALIGAVLVSVIFGVSALSSNRWIAGGIRGLTILVVSVPSFWLALLFIYVFVLTF